MDNSDSQTDTQNPYAASSGSVDVRLIRRPLKGFARGARNGLLWAAFPLSALAFAAYGESHGNLLVVLMSVLPILTLWIFAAGQVAMKIDRDNDG